jgi:ribosome biogenesis protein Nip4
MQSTRSVTLTYLTHFSLIGCYAYQVWIKPNGEMPFLYGNHVLKAHLGRITEDTPEHQGVVVFSMSDVPLVRLASSDFTGIHENTS